MVLLSLPPLFHFRAALWGCKLWCVIYGRLLWPTFERAITAQSDSLRTLSLHRTLTNNALQMTQSFNQTRANVFRCWRLKHLHSGLIHVFINLNTYTLGSQTTRDNHRWIRKYLNVEIPFSNSSFKLLTKRWGTMFLSLVSLNVFI